MVSSHFPRLAALGKWLVTTGPWYPTNPQASVPVVRQVVALDHVVPAVELVAVGGVADEGSVVRVLLLDVVVRLFELGDGGLLHVVAVPPAGEPGLEPGLAGALRGHTVLVGAGVELPDLVAVARGQGVGRGRGQRQVPLGVAAQGTRMITPVS